MVKIYVINEAYMERILAIVRPAFGGLKSWFLEPILSAYLSTKMYILKHLSFLRWPHMSEDRGFIYDNEQDYLFLPEIFSARKHFHHETLSFAVFSIAVLFVGTLGAVLVLNISFFVLLSGVVALFYLTLLLFKLFIVKKSTDYPLIDFSPEEIANITPDELPIYTIFIPLKYEAEVMHQIIKAMSSLDYPSEKLDFIITLEEYDFETRSAFLRLSPPSNFRIVTLPPSGPQTKPKALNVAFKEAKGDLLVIYDAEIIPDVDQLKKAYLAFKRHPELGVVQTRLDHYNYDQNILTRFFNAEFSFYYDLFLPGLQRFGFPVPLSGHSVHFRKDVLSNIGAWDPYNLTEDCDVGMRVYRQGYKAGMINSMSQEEATGSLGGWVRQRTRWMKGFIQTTIVHLRHPLRFKSEIGGWKNFFAFVMTVPGTVVLNLLNFFSWIFFIIWFLFEPVTIQKLFPLPILYIAVGSFLVGNILFTYFNVLGVFKRGRYSLVKYIFLSPIYWGLLAIATLRAIVQFFTNPYHWEKTMHGSHLEK